MSPTLSTVSLVPNSPRGGTTSQHTRPIEKPPGRTLEYIPGSDDVDEPAKRLGRRTLTQNTFESAYARIVPSDKRNQFILSGTLRWLVGAALGTLFYITLWLHQGRTLSLRQKSVFDAIIVGISIALGLNFAASLREIAIYMRWWFFARKQIHIREASLCPDLPVLEASFCD